ncbi:hypothetical protein EB796_007456 [Bugula neritina]|uniref:Uncharacterized protein n=1 Tax=Bugula neritina TaxID=10212 RepID=A0A7J7K8T2_BUGNE|nr:hypothetical protein EB796_007456 [Bugula neritina]
MIKVVFALTLMGLLVQVAGHVTCLIHHRRQRPNSCMFITGVWYVTSGLGLLAAIIVLTGLLTEESMRQKELPDHEVKLFRYHYASSFVVLTLSFCLVEIAAILAVYLFIVRYKVAYKANHSQLHELKSRTQLVGELLNRRRMNSTSTTEGSRRPSYLPCPTNSALRAETNHSYTPAELEEEYIRAGNDLHPSIDGRCNGVRCSEGSCELVSIPPPPMFSNTPVITVHRQCTTTV